MPRNTAHLKSFVIRATDDELGTLDQLFFDDKTWAIGNALRLSKARL